eukprot:5984544-Alexandrium_andersonii.AAC.1
MLSAASWPRTSPRPAPVVAARRHLECHLSAPPPSLCLARAAGRNLLGAAPASHAEHVLGRPH